jgi:tyrosine-protein kinase Etk/Wzc
MSRPPECPQHQPMADTAIPDAEAVNVLDYLEILAKRKRFIFSATVTVFILSIGISLLLPKIFISTARILPPQQDQGLSGMMLGQLGGMAGLAGDLLGKGGSADLYVGILKSEAVSDAIIDRFKLMDVYQKDYRLDTYNSLKKRVEIAVGKKDDIISITVQDGDASRAANMANAFVEELAKLTVSLNITGANQDRSFYEEHLSKAKAELARAEDALKSFQAKNKALDIRDQAKATIEGIAQLNAQLAVQEVQRQALRRQFTDSSQEVKNASAVVANLRTQIAQLEGNSAGSSIPSAGSIPALGQESVRLMREFKIQEAIVELLTKQYEMAKISQAKDVSTLKVIQKARVADKKSKPARSVLVAMATLAAFFLAIFAAFVIEYFEQLPEAKFARWRRLFHKSVPQKR